MLFFYKINKDFLWTVWIFFFFSNATAWGLPPPEDRFEFSHSSMGSLFVVTVYGKDAGLAKRTAESAFSMVDRLNLIMSDYNPESELMKLSRQSGQGIYVPVSKELFEVLKESLYWSEWSGGLFDITVGAYTQLWRRAGRKGRLPDASDLQKADSVVGFHHIKLDTVNRAVLLEQPGMQLDLGGIAKGYTVDLIFDLFASKGFDQVLVDGGGDIRAGENPPGTEGWKIVMETYAGADSISYISNCSIATSGDLYRYTEVGGVRYSHIIDPSTGYGITTPRTVTVTAPTCMQADVLASILSIAGAGKGFELLNGLKDVSAMMVEIEDGIEKDFYY